MTTTKKKTLAGAFGVVMLGAGLVPLLVAGPAVAATGCAADSTTLTIEKVNNKGEPLEGATFGVKGPLTDLTTFGPRYDENTLKQEYEEAHAGYQTTSAALADAKADLEAGAAAVESAESVFADAQAALDAAQSAEPSAEVQALEAALETVLAEEDDLEAALADAEADLTAAEFGGDPAEIADAQAAVDAAQAELDAKVAEREDLQAQIASADAPRQQAIADAQAARDAAFEELEAASDALDGLQAAADTALEASKEAGERSNRAFVDQWMVGSIGETQVTSDADGLATVDIASYAGCGGDPGYSLSLDPSSVIIEELEAPAGYQLAETSFTLADATETDDGYVLQVVNEVAPDEQEEPKPEKPEPTVTVTTTTPLSNTGSDLEAAPLAAGAAGIALLGAATLAAPGLVRRFRASKQ